MTQRTQLSAAVFFVCFTTLLVAADGTWVKSGGWTVSGPAVDVPARLGDQSTQVALDAGRLHILFEGLKPGSRESHIYYRSYDIEQNKWTELQKLGDTSDIGVLPSIIVRQAELHAIWLTPAKRRAGARVQYARSLDGGGQWAMQSFEIGRSTRRPQLAVGSNGELWMCTSALSGSDEAERLVIYHSCDAGASWAPEAPRRPDQPSRDSQPMLASLAGGKMLLSWIEDTPDHSSIMVALYEPKGGWSQPVQIPRSAGDRVIEFRMEVLEKVLCLVWTERGDHARTLKLAVSRNEGKDWEVVKEIRVNLCRSLEFRELRTEKGLEVIWRQALDPFHLGEHSIWTLGISGSDGKLDNENRVEATREHLSGLAVASFRGEAYLALSRLGRAGVKPVVYGVRNPGEACQIWQGEDSRLPDLEIVALNTYKQDLLLLYREARPLGNPLLRTLEGELRLLRLEKQDLG